jgi:hypothetical protein
MLTGEKFDPLLNDLQEKENNINNAVSQYFLNA